MEIAQVCPLYHPYLGGVETHVGEISKRLVKLDANVKVYTTDPSGGLPRRQLIDNIEILRFRSFTPKQIYFFSPSLLSALRSLKDIDVVHVHAYPNFPALAVALAKSGSRRPVVFTPHYGGYRLATEGTSVLQGCAKKFYNLFAGRFMFERADAVVALSKIESSLLGQGFGLRTNRIRYIPNGVNVEEYACPRKSTGSKVLLYVGRVEKYKGLASLLRVFSKVRRLFASSRLVIVGKGAYKKDLVSTVEKCGLQDHVDFLQDVPKEKLLQIYLTSGVFVLLSQYEAFPITVIEAMASGLPVIATNVGGIPDIIKPGKNGFLVGYPPSEELVVRYISLLFNQSELSHDMGQKAREFVLSNFTWDRTAKDLLKLYEELA